MPNDDTGVALANFTQLYGAYKNACDVESVRAAEKAAADAELALATNAKNQADAAAEAALTALLAALADAGITPTPAAG